VALAVTDTAGARASVSLPLTVRRLAPFWLTTALVALLLVVLPFLGALLLHFLRLRTAARRQTPLRITSASVPNARASFDYSVQLACAGGVPPLRWQLVEGSLPPGMELTEEGLLHGLPFEGIPIDHTKEQAFTVEVRDEAGQRARQQL
jgi:hypothetical protein